jgi:chemotaxis protein methyltransferase CheR
MSKRRAPSRPAVELSDELYHGFRELLRTRSGLSYPQHKRNDLAHGLQMVLNATDHPDLAALYADAVGGGAAWEAILAQMTIGETYFFRNKAQFDALRQHILPELIARRASAQSLRMWSAGCATGEEPYSLAMAIAELLAGDDRWHVTILATDINPIFLDRAGEGIYGEWSFRETAATHKRLFHQEGNRWRIDPSIRRMVNFARLNLVDPCYPSLATGTYALDIILCRNVTIYFDIETTRQIVERFFDALAPGGWLIVGYAEPQASIYRQFEVHNFPDTVVYRKPLSTLLSFPRPQSDPMTVGATPSIPRASTPAIAPNEPASVSISPSVPCPDQQAASEADRATAPEAAAIAEQLELGRQCADRGEWAAAESYCKRALTRAPLSIDAHYLLAQIHEHQGQLDAALAGYRRTVYLDHSFVVGMIGMGNVWRQMGQIANARRSYRNALQHLERLGSNTPVPSAGGATASTLAALVTQYVQLLV